MPKIALSTYSFFRYIKDGRLTQFSCIQKAADMGFDAVEFVDITPHDGSSRADYAKKLGEECARLSLPIANYTFGADLLNGSDGDLDAEAARVQKEIDMAVILGAKSVRHDATLGYPQESRGWKGFDTVLPRLAEGVRRITEYAAEKGVRTMVENHGRFVQDSDRVEKLVNAVAHENFGLLCDMGNFMGVGENPAAAFSRVAPYAFYVHAKDNHFKSGMEADPGEGFYRTRQGDYCRGAIIGHGNAPVKQCLQILKDTGYQGNLGIEFEGLEDNELGIRIGLANLRRYVKEVWGE